LDPQDWPLHMLQQFIDEVDVQVGQLKALDLGLGSTLQGQPNSSPAPMAPGPTVLHSPALPWHGVGPALLLFSPWGSALPLSHSHEVQLSPSCPGEGQGQLYAVHRHQHGPREQPQTRDTRMAFVGNMGHRHCHRPLLLQDLEHRHGPYRWAAALGGIAGPSLTSGCSSPPCNLQFCLFFCFVLFCFVFLVFRDRVSLYSPGCPGTHFVDQAGLELRNTPASASRVLGLKTCATTPSFCLFIAHKPFHLSHLHHTLAYHLSLWLSSTQPHRMAGKGLWVRIWFYVDVRDLNSGLHACAVITLTSRAISLFPFKLSVYVFACACAQVSMRPCGSQRTTYGS
jgi:hypothetical protein